MKVRTNLSEKFELNSGVHHGSHLSPVSLAIVIDVVANEIREDTLQETLYADDIVVIAENMAEQQERFYSWKSAFDIKGQKEILLKTKVMVIKIGQFTVKTSCKKDPCGICGRITMVNAVLSKSSGNWIHGRCAESKG